MGSKLTFDKIYQKALKLNKTFHPVRMLNNDEDVEYHCDKCNQNFIKYRNWNFRKVTCPVCSGYIVITGYNDWLTLNPQFNDYLLNKEDYKNEPKFSRKYGEFKCDKCGKIRKLQLGSLSRRGFSCPCKDGYFSVNKGFNDIYTKANWMVEYLLDKQDAYKYTCNSPKKIKFKCPRCNNISEKIIRNIYYRNKFSCPYCSDGISYPNKFGRCFIKQTDAQNIEFEYCRDWTNCRKYDIYFEKNGNKYFIEMDGEQHYYYDENNNKSPWKSKTSKEIKENDDYKNKLAKEHDITIIRIDCRESSKQYITNSIKNSELANLFDLNSINWDECDMSKYDSLIVDICNEYNNNALYNYEIAEKYNIDITTVTKYIKTGKDIGLINSNITSSYREHLIKSQRNIL